MGVPRGKIEPGESDLDAARRELKEELDLDVVRVGEVEVALADPGSRFVIEFVPVEVEGEPTCLEHAALAWVKEEELLELPLAPTDRRYALRRLGKAEESSP